MLAQTREGMMYGSSPVKNMQVIRRITGWGLIDLPLRALRKYRRSSDPIPSAASGVRNRPRCHSTRHSQRPETSQQKKLDGVTDSELVCVAQVTLAGERQVSVSPLVLAL